MFGKRKEKEVISSSLAGLPMESQDEDCPICVSDPDSMARKIVAAGGGLLPVTTEALDECSEEFAEREIQWWTGYKNAQAFYESFGIAIGKETEIPGWHEATLPEGLYIEYNDAADASCDEAVYFRFANGGEAFHIITLKEASQGTYGHLGWPPENYPDPKRNCRLWRLALCAYETNGCSQGAYCSVRDLFQS